MRCVYLSMKLKRGKQMYYDYLKNQYNDLSKLKSNQKFIMSGDSNLEDYCYSDNNISPKALRTNLLPQQIIGDLHRGKIYICSLNPGYGSDDEIIEDEKLAEKNGFPYYKEKILNEFLQGEKSERKNHFFIAEQMKKSGGAKWWRGKLHQRDSNSSLVQAIINEYEQNGIIVDEEMVFSFLSKLIVSLELFPYHSKQMDKTLLKNCESVEKIKEYVHNELIPNAKKNNQIVIFTRSIKEWNVSDEEKNMKNVVLCNTNPRCITFNVKKCMGKFILDYIRQYTNNFSDL